MNVMGSRIGRTLYLLGAWCSMLVVLTAPPALVAASAGDLEALIAFVATGALSAFVSMILVFGFQGYARRRNLTNLVMLPFLGFLLLAFLAGLPRFIHAGEAGQVSLILFEGMAALSTSGVSAYSAADGSILAFQLWQALLSGLGAFGSVVLALTIASHVNGGGIKLHRSPVHNAAQEMGHSRLSAVARQLAPVFLVLIVMFFILFAMSGNGAGASLIMALGAISTAGIYPGGEAVLSGSLTQLVALVGMIVGGLNLDYLYGVWQGRRSGFSMGEEARILARTVLVVAIGLMLVVLMFSDGMAPGFSDVFGSLFLAVSAVTTTGWAPGGAENLVSNEAILFMLLAVATVGGAVTSSSGGLKLMRFIILIRHGGRELARLAHPHGVAMVRYAGVVVGEKDLQAVWLTMGAFVLTLMGGIMLLAVQGHEFQLAYTLGITALTTAGPLAGMMDGSVFQGYGSLSAADHTILAFLMLFGRLEISLFLALVTRSFWRS